MKFQSFAAKISDIKDDQAQYIHYNMIVLFIVWYLHVS